MPNADIQIVTSLEQGTRGFTPAFNEYQFPATHPQQMGFRFNADAPAYQPVGTQQDVPVRRRILPSSTFKKIRSFSDSK